VFGGMIWAKQDIKSVSTTGETTFWGHPSSYVVTDQTNILARGENRSD
jgi:hypothetical protein